jgi:hypothetical protein
MNQAVATLFPALRDGALTGSGQHMQLETKFLRLRTLVTIGSFFGDWQVGWLGGWTRDRFSCLVMVVEIERGSFATPPAALELPFREVEPRGRYSLK